MESKIVLQPKKPVKKNDKGKKSVENYQDSGNPVLDGMSHREYSVLARTRILPVKNASKGTKSVLRCHACSNMMASMEDAVKHATSDEHQEKVKEADLLDLLTNLPSATECHSDALDELFEDVVRKGCLPEEARTHRLDMVDKIKEVVERQVSGVKVALYGSLASGLSLTDSNVNITVLSREQEKKTPGAYLRRVSCILKECQLFQSVEDDFTDEFCTVCRSEDGIVYRVSVNNDHYVQTAELLKKYLELDERCWKLAMLFRIFAKEAMIDSTYKGTLTPCAFPILSVFYLQHCHVPVLPNLQQIAQSKTKKPSDEEVRKMEFRDRNLSYLYDLNRLSEYWGASENSDGLGKLWLNMLRFYNFDFNKAEYVVSITEVRPVTKFRKQWGSKKLAIEDPFNFHRNMCHTISSTSTHDYIMTQLKGAYHYFGVPQLLGSETRPKGPLFTAMKLKRHLATSLIVKNMSHKDTQYKTEVAKIRKKVSDFFLKLSPTEKDKNTEMTFTSLRRGLACAFLETDIEDLLKLLDCVTKPLGEEISSEKWADFAECFTVCLLKEVFTNTHQPRTKMTLGDAGKAAAYAYEKAFVILGGSGDAGNEPCMSKKVEEIVSGACANVRGDQNNGNSVLNNGRVSLEAQEPTVDDLDDLTCDSFVGKVVEFEIESKIMDVAFEMQTREIEPDDNNVAEGKSDSVEISAKDICDENYGDLKFWSIEGRCFEDIIDCPKEISYVAEAGGDDESSLKEIEETCSEDQVDDSKKISGDAEAGNNADTRSDADSKLFEDICNEKKDIEEMPSQEIHGDVAKDGIENDTDKEDDAKDSLLDDEDDLDSGVENVAELEDVEDKEGEALLEDSYDGTLDDGDDDDPEVDMDEFQSNGDVTGCSESDISSIALDRSEAFEEDVQAAGDTKSAELTQEEGQNASMDDMHSKEDCPLKKDDFAFSTLSSWSAAFLKDKPMISLNSDTPGFFHIGLLSELTRSDLKFEFGGCMLGVCSPPPVVCMICSKKGHYRDKCTEDEPDLSARPVQTTREHHSIFSKVIESVFRDCVFTQELDSRWRLTFDMVDHLVHSIYRDACLEVFGSCINGFGSLGSDLDLCITFPPTSRNKPEGEAMIAKVIHKLAGVFRKHPHFNEIRAIPHAKVPIVKFFCMPFQIEGDISLSNILAMRNSKMLKVYSDLDPRVSRLGLAIKCLAKICQIGYAAHGSVSSYAYILLLIHYLQQQNVLPVLQEMIPVDGKRPVFILEGWDTWFQDDRSFIAKNWKCTNAASMSELWLGFMNYYLWDFPWKTQVVTIRQKKPLYKVEKLWNSTLAVEDPFDLTHNLTGRLSRKMVTYILTIFHRTVLRHSSPPKDTVPVHNLMYYYFDAPSLTGGNGPPQDRACHNCGKNGHMARECTEPSSKKRKEEEEKRKKGSANEAHFPSLPSREGSQDKPSATDHPLPTTQAMNFSQAVRSPMKPISGGRTPVKTNQQQMPQPPRLNAGVRGMTPNPGFVTSPARHAFPGGHFVLPGPSPQHPGLPMQPRPSPGAMRTPMNVVTQRPTQPAPDPGMGFRVSTPNASALSSPPMRGFQVPAAHSGNMGPSVALFRDPPPPSMNPAPYHMAGGMPVNPQISQTQGFVVSTTGPPFGQSNVIQSTAAPTRLPNELSFSKQNYIQSMMNSGQVQQQSVPNMELLMNLMTTGGALPAINPHNTSNNAASQPSGQVAWSPTTTATSIPNAPATAAYVPQQAVQQTECRNIEQQLKDMLHIPTSLVGQASNSGPLPTQTQPPASGPPVGRGQVVWSGVQAPSMPHARTQQSGSYAQASVAHSGQQKSQGVAQSQRNDFGTPPGLRQQGYAGQNQGGQPRMNQPGPRPHQSNQRGGGSSQAYPQTRHRGPPHQKDTGPRGSGQQQYYNQHPQNMTSSANYSPAGRGRGQGVNAGRGRPDRSVSDPTGGPSAQYSASNRQGSDQRPTYESNRGGRGRGKRGNPR